MLSSICVHFLQSHFLLFFLSFHQQAFFTFSSESIQETEPWAGCTSQQGAEYSTTVHYKAYCYAHIEFLIKNVNLKDRQEQFLKDFNRNFRQFLENFFVFLTFDESIVIISRLFRCFHSLIRLKFKYIEVNDLNIWIF